MALSYKDKLYAAQTTLAVAGTAAEGWEKAAALRLKHLVRSFRRVRAQAKYVAELPLKADISFPPRPNLDNIRPVAGQADAMAQGIADTLDWLSSCMVLALDELSEYAMIIDITATRAEATHVGLTPPDQEEEEESDEEDDDEEQEEKRTERMPSSYPTPPSSPSSSRK